MYSFQLKLLSISFARTDFAQPVGHTMSANAAIADFADLQEQTHQHTLPPIPHVAPYQDLNDQDCLHSEQPAVTGE